MTWKIKCENRDGYEAIGLSWHQVLVENTTGGVFCGSSWCTGKCGHPALVLTGYPDLKAMSSSVACGAMFQSFRGHWVGEKIETTGLASEDGLKMMWW